MDTCDWIQEKSRDSEEWTRNKGFTKSQINFKKENIRFKTGPQLDHRKSKIFNKTIRNNYNKNKIAN